MCQGLFEDIIPSPLGAVTLMNIQLWSSHRGVQQRHFRGNLSGFDLHKLNSGPQWIFASGGQYADSNNTVEIDVLSSSLIS